MGSAVPDPSALVNSMSPVDPVAVVTVNLESVDVSARVNAMSRASVVVMVLPASYDACKPATAAEHFIILFEPSIQSVVPVDVASPVTFKKESASVFTVTEFVPLGVNVEAALAVNDPFAVVAPVIVRALFTVVVPEPAPIFTAVPAPAIFTVAALVLNTFAVPAVVVSDPPFTAAFPAVVTLPVKVEVPSMVRLPLA